MALDPRSGKETVSKVCSGIRTVRAEIAVNRAELPLDDVDTLLSVALSNAEGVLAKLKARKE